MTHPTIEAAVREAAEWRGLDLAKLHPLDKEAITSDAKAAARVILSAPPSEAEIEAAARAICLRGIGGPNVNAHNPDIAECYTSANWRRYEADARDALTAAFAKRLEELGGK